MKSKIKDKLVKAWEVGGAILIGGLVIYFVGLKYVVTFLILQGALALVCFYDMLSKECKENSELRRELDKHRR
jgi:hypothetical protein